MIRRSSSASSFAAFLWFTLHVAAQYDSCVDGTIDDIGNGRCDTENNNPSCGFDGGDCCSCTCVDTSLYSCTDNEFHCIFPDCGDVVATSEEERCLDDYWGDAYCDPINNHPSCDYDGGDCCPCSCLPAPGYQCGLGGFACEDPACFNPNVVADFPDCTGSWLTIGDGFCDAENNNPSCGYDGGDCCLCSCSGTSCTVGELDCLDPSAYTAFFDCEAPPSAALPCLADVQRAWVVGDSAQAQDLAAAVNCSGGSFEVDWRGTVAVGEPFYVVDGTELTISGDGSTAVIDGNGSTRLFTVVNASLHLNHVNISSGASRVGGGVAAAGSSLTFNGTNFVGNSASGNGGAIYVSESSYVSCVGGGVFADNRASMDGGALFATGTSQVSCGGSWLNNTAGDSGGAVRIHQVSAMSWTDDTVFAYNTASKNGGAVSLYNRSSLSWSGTTTFRGNSAIFSGGAIIATKSNVSWDAATLFESNAADASGAIGAFSGSSVSWNGGDTTRFIGQRAFSAEGALHVSDSQASWSAATEFEDNAALSGGAVFLWNGSHVEWTGDTEFSSNKASGNGGVVGSFVLDSLYNPQDSYLIVDGTTTFSNNTSGANGGALALLGSVSLAIGTKNAVFVGNTADVAGGAVFVSSTAIGPTFVNVSFISNSAQVGGAISLISSGTSFNPEDYSPAPTTFEQCRFTRNQAIAMGGAVDTAAGQDNFVKSVFEGNTAGTGGALRLAGTAEVNNCSFVENVSDDGGGAAVSNIGFVSRASNLSFSRNLFGCQEGMFLELEESGTLYEAICDGCPIECEGCSFEEPQLVPKCSDALEHSNSSGGTVTLDALVIEPGYWRATPSSENVLECYNADACLGGVTGSENYCLEGYGGPYCAICSDGYTARLGMTCSKCSDSAGGIVLGVSASVAGLLFIVAVASYAASGESGGRARGVVERAGRFVPLQSVKIVIVAWQILTQFTSVASISYPHVYQRFLDALEVFNFDLGWVLSAGCVVDIDFHDRLLVSTIAPIVGLLFLAGVYAAAARNSHRSSENLQRVWHKHVSLVLLLTFLVYASVSAVLFQAFACEELDDRKNYLRADYRIECDSPKHGAFQVYAGVMIVLYTVGIPALYGGFLIRDSDVLRRDEAGREQLARIAPTADLWKPYRPSVFYYEVIECARRVLLAGVVVFIYPNTAAQIAVALLMAVVFAMISEALSPYASRWDTWLCRMGHAVVAVSMYVALLLKVDVSDERASSQKVFESLLVAAHVCMVGVVLLEMTLEAISLCVEKREKQPPSASFRRGRGIFGLRGSVSNFTEVDDDPFSGSIYEVERQRFEDQRRFRRSASSSSAVRKKNVKIATEGSLALGSVDTTESPSVFL